MNNEITNEKLARLKALAESLSGWHWPDRKRDPDTGVHYFGQWKEGEFYELGTIDGSNYTLDYADDIRLLKFFRAIQPSTILALIAKIESLEKAAAPVAAEVQGDALAALHEHMQNKGYYADDSTMPLFKHVVSALAQRAASQPDSVGVRPVDADALRTAGRAEALAILMRLDPEAGIDDYTGWRNSGAPGDEGGAFWKEDKLRELFVVDGSLADMMDKAEGEYWHYKGLQMEAEHAKNFAANLHSSGKVREVLAKAGEFDLMADLCRNAPPLQPDSGRDAALREAVGKLIKAKGRFHTEQNYAAVVAAYDAVMAAQQSQKGGAT